jgi:O-antigen/teichoic acid export membrane protein
MRDLGQRAFSGFLWAGAADAAGKLLVFVATIVLARLLVPSEFGLVAFCLAVIYALEYIGDLGLGAALIYRSDAEDPRISSTAFWIGMIGSLALFGAAWFAAPLLAEIGPGDEVVPLFRVLALQFPFSALGKAHEYRLRRSLQFRTLFGPKLAGGVTKGAVSIGLALAGAGAWSLVIGQVAGTLAVSIGLWLVHSFRPKLVIARRELPSMMRFGLGIVAVGVLGQGAKNFDFIVVGGKLGAAALGVYYLAFRLPELVILTGFRVANDVLFPFYARLRDPGADVDGDDLRQGYLQTIRLAAMVAWPAAFGMAALALPLVLTVYGERWRSAAEPMALVAIWAGLASLATMPGAVFKALGRSWLLTATGIMQIAILFPAIWFSAPYGITAVAASQVAEKTLSLALLGVVVGRVLGLRWYATFVAAAPALALSVVTAGVLYALSTALPPGAAVAVGIPLGAALYLVLLRHLLPEGFGMLVRPLLDLRRRMAATAGLSLLIAALLLTACNSSSQDRERAARAPDPASTIRRTFYVAPGGSDSGPGSRARPFGTLAHGLQRLRYGQRLYVRGGTYTERIKVKAAPGRRHARVRVTNYPGERPLLRGQLWIGNPSYWTIRGLDVTWADDNPDEPLVRIYGGTGWRLTRAEIWGSRSTSGLQVDDGPRDNLGRWVVKGNCIHDTHATDGVNQDHNVYVADMSASPRPDGLISRNILFNAENGRGIKLGPGGTTGGAVNVDVRFNTIYNSSQNVSLSRDTSQVTIERNILVKARESNITAFRLYGSGNVARQNVGYAAPHFLARTGTPGSLVDGGGNLRSRHLRFDSIGCSGFHPGRFGNYGAHG